MKNIFIKFIVFSIYSFCVVSCYASNIVKPVNIYSVRIWPSPESIRVVFDLSEQVDYKIYNLTNPNRVAIDFKNAKLNVKLEADLNKAPRHSHIRQLRTGTHKEGVRVVFELDDSVTPNSFTLKPNERYGHRLVIDLESNEKQEILALFDLDELDKVKINKQQHDHDPILNITNTPKITSKINPLPTQKLIVAIDAGHGGEDPGAVGRYGTLEKVVVLEIARMLKDEINSKHNMQAFLIRNGDYYVGLRDRRLRARKHKADLFISIHADAFSNSRADGASVFVLSEKGASSAAARWLAESQNRADTIGGVKLEHGDDSLTSMILDMSQTKNCELSVDAAKNILGSMKKTVVLHKPHVEQASFSVLKAPDMPSVLIETGFISNPRTELKLKEKTYQQKIVKSIICGIEQYFSSQPKRSNFYDQKN